MFVHDIIVKYLINELITKHHHLTKSYVEQNVPVENEHQIVSNEFKLNLILFIDYQTYSNF
jgi:hypothetical protein